MPSRSNAAKALAPQTTPEGEESPFDFLRALRATQQNALASRKFAGLRLPDKPTEDRIFLLATQHEHRHIRELAKEVLVNGVLALAIKLARKYSPQRAPDETIMEELKAMALEGVAKALTLYNPQHQTNSRFSHVVYWQVKESMQNQSASVRDLVKKPNTQAHHYLRRHFHAALTHLRAQDPDLRDDDIPAKMAHYLNTHPVHVPPAPLTPKTIAAFRSNILNAGEDSLHAPFAGTDALTLEHVLPDTAPTPEDVAETHSRNAFMRAALGEALSTLSEREQRIISARYLCGDDEAATLENLGLEFNVSRERIRQIEKKAIEKLKAALAVDPDSKSQLLDLIAD